MGAENCGWWIRVHHYVPEQVWIQIEALKYYPPVVRLVLPRDVKLALLRFMSLNTVSPDGLQDAHGDRGDCVPAEGYLARWDSLTVAWRPSRHWCEGSTQRPLDTLEVLTVWLFDGIGALVASDLLQLSTVAHGRAYQHGMQWVRKLGHRERFPSTLLVRLVALVTEEKVAKWACEYSSVGVVLVGAGPPCQDVSKFNVDRKGSQKGLRSSLYKEVPRVGRRCMPFWKVWHRWMRMIGLPCQLTWSCFLILWALCGSHWPDGLGCTGWLGSFKVRTVLFCNHSATGLYGSWVVCATWKKISHVYYFQTLWKARTSPSRTALLRWSFSSAVAGGRPSVPPLSVQTWVLCPSSQAGV